jgi:hypothetical protein
MEIADDIDEILAPPPRCNYKGGSPWSAPPVVESDAMVFHVYGVSNAPPKV